MIMLSTNAGSAIRKERFPKSGSPLRDWKNMKIPHAVRPNEANSFIATINVIEVIKLLCRYLFLSRMAPSVL